MPIAINGLDGNPFTVKDLDGSANNFLTTRHKLAFSGSYPALGDTLDFTTVAGQIPSGVIPLVVTQTEQGTAATPSLSAAGGFYQVVQAATPALNNYKLKVFKNTAGSIAEYPAGAYAADVTTYNVFLEVTWRKLSN